MIRIGDFSKLSQVSIKTLRYYDEMNLLKPVDVDRFTGYRFYEYAQLARLNRILALKELGFPLEEIRKLLDERVTAGQLRGMLKLRQAESRQRVQEETQRLERIEARLRQIEQEQKMPRYDVVIKNVPSVRVAALRGVVPTPPDQGRLWKELEGYLAMQRIRPQGPCFSLYHDEEYKERDWDIEVCEPLAEMIPPGGAVKVYELPAVDAMACALHAGPFTTLQEAYDAILRWVDENGYLVCGPIREVYLREAERGSQTDPLTVTEIQVPVKKA